VLGKPIPKTVAEVEEIMRGFEDVRI